MAVKTSAELFEIATNLKTNLSNEGKATVILTDITDAYAELEKESIANKEENVQLKLDKEALRSANMALFQKTGETFVEESKLKEEQNKTKMKFDDIFKEKRK